MIVRYSDYVENVRYSDLSSKRDGSLDCYDSDAINASILNIMLTDPGTVPFNYEFGAGVGLFIFEIGDRSEAERFFSTVLDKVSTYEKRMTIDRQSIEIQIDNNNQSVDIYIPYIINDTGIPGEFYKRLSF